MPAENLIEESSLDENQPAASNNPFISKGLQHEKPMINLQDYLKSIVDMPKSIQKICVTNSFCWMAHVCYSLYFTDFVGEVTFEGDPKAENGTLAQYLYYKGVRFGCWGMALYSLSCALYSLIIEKLLKRHGLAISFIRIFTSTSTKISIYTSPINRIILLYYVYIMKPFRVKRVYVGGLLTYSTGMFLMVITRSKIAVILLSGTAGIMYATVFTMPYVLVVHYHVQGVVSVQQLLPNELHQIKIE